MTMGTFTISVCGCIKGRCLESALWMDRDRTQTLQTLAGVRHRSSGSVILNGTELKYQGAKKALKYGIGYVPENRKVQALCLKLSVRDNLALASLLSAAEAGVCR